MKATRQAVAATVTALPASGPAATAASYGQECRNRRG